jgi:general secretion pathway protein H
MRPSLPRCGPRGFTLIELLVVVTLIGLAAAVATLALRDPDASRLEREAARLSALLDSARAQSRATGVAVTWVPMNGAGEASSSGQVDFRFKGLPESDTMPTRWLGPGLVAEVQGSKGLVLGPEPLIGPQQVTLRLDQQAITLRTDGLGPFVVVYPQEPPTGGQP